MVYRKVKRYLKKGARNAFRLAKKDPIRTASRALSLARYLHTIVNAELKSATYAATGAAINTTGTMFHLSNLTQGDLHNQRNGMSILLRYINCQGCVRINSAATSSVVKLMLVIDQRKNYTATDPGVGEIFEGSGAVTAPFTTLDVNSRGRYKILASRTYTMSTNGKQIVTFNFNRSVQQHCKWEFNSQDRLEGHVYLAIVSNEAVNTPTLDIHNKIKYYDN